MRTGGSPQTLRGSAESEGSQEAANGIEGGCGLEVGRTCPGKSAKQAFRGGPAIIASNCKHFATMITGPSQKLRCSFWEGAENLEDPRGIPLVL